MSTESTPGYTEKLISYLNKKWTRPQTCPICSCDQWLLREPGAIAPDWYPEGNKATSKSGLKMFVIFCENCGYLVSFDASFVMREIEKQEGIEEVSKDQ